MKTRKARTAGTEKGSAFIMVVLILLIASALASQLIASTRAQMSSAHASIQNLKARLAVESAINAHIVTLIDGTAIDFLQDGGQQVEVNTNNHRVILRISSEAGKININGGNLAILQRLIERFCTGPIAAREISERVADYVDPDDIAKPNGLERAGYSAMGLNYPPGNRRFATLGELRRVPGVSSQLFRKIMPYLTVESFQQLPELHVAAPVTRAAVLGSSKHASVPSPTRRTANDHISSLRKLPMVGIYTLSGHAVETNTSSAIAIEVMVYITGVEWVPYLVLGRRVRAMVDDGTLKCEDMQSR